MQKTNMEDKMAELSQEEMMDVSGGAAGKNDFFVKLWDSIVGIFNSDDKK